MITIAASERVGAVGPDQELILQGDGMIVATAVRLIVKVVL